MDQSLHVFLNTYTYSDHIYIFGHPRLLFPFLLTDLLRQVTYWFTNHADEVLA